MKVLFINPPNAVLAKWNFPLNIFQPLGIAYIAAVLENHGHQVKILDALALGWQNERVINGVKYLGLTQEQIAKEIKDFAPEIVGIANLFTSQAQEASAVANTVKQVNPEILVIAGGAHATTLPEEVLANTNVDAVVIGEGEYTVLEIVESFKNKKSWLEVAGLAYRGGDGQIIRTQPRNPIADLDALPLPARHLLPMDIYFAAAKKVKAARSISTFGKRWATLITSRGCPFGCIFCTIHLVMQRGWRSRSPHRVIEEIEFLINNYGIEHLDIEDDNFTLDKDRAKKILDLMAEKKINIQWSTPNGIRADTVDEELIEKMKASGCTRTIVAPESGNQHVVDKIIKKGIDLEKVVQTVKWCKKYKLLTEAFFVLGFPGETIAQMNDTIRYAKKLKKLGVDDCAFYIATPFFGTELYKIAKENGYLDKDITSDKLNTLSGEVLIETADFTKAELVNIWQQAKKINPPISQGRIKLAWTMLMADPLRALSYAKEGLIKFIKK